MEGGSEMLSRPGLQSFVSSGTATSGEEMDYGEGLEGHEMYSDRATARHFLPHQTSSLDGGTSLASYPSFRRTSTTSVSARATARPPIATPYLSIPTEATMNGLPGTQQEPIRPSSIRQLSNAYASPRRSHQHANTPGKSRVVSGRRGRPNSHAEYRAQEKAYVQKIRLEDAPNNGFFAEPRKSSLNYSDGSSGVDESPGSGSFVEDEPYVQGTLTYYGNKEHECCQEKLKMPANRERLEWHAMLAHVLTGDVVKQEKKRLTRGSEQQGDNTLKAEIWLGVRAKTCGRSLTTHRRLIEKGRREVKQTIEQIIGFEINGEAEVGKSPLEQVQQVIRRMEKVEGLYPTQQGLREAQPRAASISYKSTCDAVLSWYNTTKLINTELGVLQQWVGNAELDLTQPRTASKDQGGYPFDDSSFIDRILKEDGLKSLQSEYSLLEGVNTVINKAKDTLIQNAEAFVERHLPPYIEELLTLINFPTRLIQEIIRTRLSYARKTKDPAQQGVLIAEQTILQMQILLTLAVKIKKAYLRVAQRQPGWDLPPCIDENFDRAVIDALQFYFKMLNWTLMIDKNMSKEAEILEQEWKFCYQLGKHLEGGDVEVAEQFSSLSSRSLNRLMAHFEKQLTRRPNEFGAEIDKRYKSIFDSVRVRQRKILRFSRILSQRFENATEYNMNTPYERYQDLLDALTLTGHFMVQAQPSPLEEKASIYVIASPTLQKRRKDIQSMLGTCYHAEHTPEDPSNPYVLILCPEYAVHWEGAKMGSDVRLPYLGIKTGRLRLVADGSLQRLANANATFIGVTGLNLNIIVEQCANLKRVDLELTTIRKTAYKLSNTIMDSIETVRRQTTGLECRELIQTCFAFATEFGLRSAIYMDQQHRAMHHLKLTHIALDWVSFVCNDCVASDRKTFRWAVVALEFATMMTRGRRILFISDTEYATLREKVAHCMSLLVSHFDIMGARSTFASQAEKQRLESLVGKLKFGYNRYRDDEESSKVVRAQRLDQLDKIEQVCKDREVERQALGRVLEVSNEADRALTQLSASAGNVHLRWQQGQFVGGGTFGSVYAAINLDSGQLMAVKEIRLQDPKLIPTIVSQIRDEMRVLRVLDHPNIVQYYGIEPHRDKVYIFMEYCSGGSLAGMLEHGRVEDETVIQVYALQMLEGLSYLHEAKVVHRDIKPENILLDHNGVIKFVDFGAAKVIANQGKTTIVDGSANKPRQESMTGTPMYMSPEMIKGGKHHHVCLGAVDVWSLGCVITEMATGTRPWASLDNEWAIMYNIAQGNSPQMPTKAQLSDFGLDFLCRCFERNPSKRLSAVELLQHEWILNIRSQMDFEPGTPQTPTSKGSYNMHSPSSGCR
jgi:mitogen-activated protein kinase kinase kinase